MKPPAAGMGRVKGSVNKSTKMAREAIAKLVDENTERLQEWLDAIAADEKQGPAVAFKMLMDVMEYHIPKLARTDVNHSGELTVRSATDLKDDELAAIATSGGG